MLDEKTEAKLKKLATSEQVENMHTRIMREVLELNKRIQLKSSQEEEFAKQFKTINRTINGIWFFNGGMWTFTILQGIVIYRILQKLTALGL